jgi:hypothetical protein
MNADPKSDAQRFGIGRVIATSLSIFAANFLRFLAIMIVVGAPVVALAAGGAAILERRPGVAVSELSVELKDPDAFQIAVFLPVALMIALGYAMILSSLTHGTLQAVRGRVAGLRECLARGLAAIPSIILACLVLLFVAVLVGGVAMFFIAMILGGLGAGAFVISSAFAVASLYGATLIWVFIPAIVAERAGALECFSRSLVLTKGHRWGIFGLLVLLALTNWLVSFLDQILTAVAPLTATILGTLWSVSFLGFGPVLAAVGYFQLRIEKEGVAGDDMVRVFD